MASSNTKNGDAKRPHPLHVSRSFTRIEPTSPSSVVRSRASTISNDSTTQLRPPVKSAASENAKPRSRPNMFETSMNSDDDNQDSSDEEPGSLPENFDALPIELASLTDRYVSWTKPEKATKLTF